MLVWLTGVKLIRLITTEFEKQAIVCIANYQASSILSNES